MAADGTDIEACLRAQGQACLCSRQWLRSEPVCGYLPLAWEQQVCHTYHLFLCAPSWRSSLDFQTSATRHLPISRIMRTHLEADQDILIAMHCSAKWGLLLSGVLFAVCVQIRLRFPQGILQHG